MTRDRGAQAPGINKVRARFEQWRQTRHGKARIPDELWAAAVEVARRAGCNRTAAALHLDGGKLRKQMLAAGAKSSRAFVELVAPRRVDPEARRPEYTIELGGRNGTLRIHCKGVTAAQLAELSRALWSEAS